jgi:hypothetical protein
MKGRSRMWPRVAAVVLCLLPGLCLVSSASAAETPQILDESVSGITETGAVLEATIHPGDGAAYYQFQLGPEKDDLPSEMLCPSSTGAEPPCEGNQSPNALPIGELAGDVQTVELDLGDWVAAGHMDPLKPGTSYEFRVIAAAAVDREDDTIEWEGPEVVGMTEWFTTPGSVDSALDPPAPEPVRPTPCRKARLAYARGCRCPGRSLGQKVKGKIRCVKVKHLPHFNLLSHPVGVPHLPRDLQYGLSLWLPPIDPPVKVRPLKLRGGTVHFGEIEVYGVGSLQTVCIRVSGERSLRQPGPRGRGSACAPVPSALRRGIAILSSCTGVRGGVLVTGLVPNGILGLGVERAGSGVIEEVIPVKNNAFVAPIERVAVVLHGMGSSGGGFEMKFPLDAFPSPRCLK